MQRRSPKQARIGRRILAGIRRISHVSMLGSLGLALGGLVGSLPAGADPRVEVIRGTKRNLEVPGRAPRRAARKPPASEQTESEAPVAEDEAAASEAPTSVQLGGTREIRTHRLGRTGSGSSRIRTHRIGGR